MLPSYVQHDLFQHQHGYDKGGNSGVVHFKHRLCIGIVESTIWHIILKRDLLKIIILEPVHEYHIIGYDSFNLYICYCILFNLAVRMFWFCIDCSIWYLCLKRFISICVWKWNSTMYMSNQVWNGTCKWSLVMLCE